MDPPLKDIEEKYEVLEKIREGGMGSIYKVRHRLLGEVRVIKIMRPQVADDTSLQSRFRQEAQAAIRLRHPNIAQLYDFSLDADGNAHIVMEYIQGITLKDLLTNDLPPVGLVLEVGIQSLRALTALHRQHMIHRDISPDNIMITRDLEGHALVKLIDLGLTKSLMNESTLTEEGTFLGKVRYASPEQFGGLEGKPGIDARSDLYSLGVVLYELLTGQLPVTGGDHSSLIAGHLFRAPVAFNDSDPEDRVPLELRTAVMSALAKNPDGRYPSAEDFCGDLLAIQEGHDDPELESWHDDRLCFEKSKLRSPTGLGTPTPSSEPQEMEAAATEVLPDEKSREETRSGPAPSYESPGRRLWLVLGVILGLVGVLAIALSVTRKELGGDPGAEESPVQEVLPVHATAGTESVPDGRLVVDARPWARVTLLADARGEPLPLPKDASTPIVFVLPPGDYQVHLEGPSGATDHSQTLSVVSGDDTSVVLDLDGIDVERFFQEAGW